MRNAKTAVIIVASLITIVVLFALSFSTAIPRDYLADRYTKVEKVELKFFSMRCNLGGKSRREYSFTARDRQGRLRSGYICATPGFSFFEPVIHEQKITELQ